MSTKCPLVSLGEVLKLCDSSVPTHQLTEVHLAGVYSFGRGLFKRGMISPAETSYKTYNRLVADDFVISQPKAWEGALARVTPEFEGWYLSPVFPTFRVNRNQLEPTFLEWYCKCKPVWAELQRKSRGIGARRESVSPGQFLSLQIPLPPLTEQRRIVARIDELAARIEEARTLNQKAEEDTDALVVASVSSWCFQNHPTSNFGEYLLEAKNGIYKPLHFWGRGLPCFRMYNIDGPNLNRKNLQLLDVSPPELETYGCKPGDLIFNRVNSAELVGKTGLVTSEFSECTFESKNMRLRVDRSRVLPEFAVLVLNSAPVRSYYRRVLKQQCGMATLNQAHLKNIPFPKLDLSQQRRIVGELGTLRMEVEKVRSLHGATGAELDALLPSILDMAFKGKL